MYYEPGKSDHGLARDPFKALVVPRPIGWISSVDPEGVVNLAPYSYFNAVATDPPIVMFCPGGRLGTGAMKDSRRNVEATGEFVVNIVPYALREAMNATSAEVGPEVDEFALAGLTPLPARLVRPPRVAGAPVHLECRHLRTVELPCNDPASSNAAVFGTVVAIHIDDSIIVDGRVDVRRFRPVARLGYMDYTSVEEVFEMIRPGASPKG